MRDVGIPVRGLRSTPYPIGLKNKKMKWDLDGLKTRLKISINILMLNYELDRKFYRLYP